jgi:asparagine synthase (glutamine-hydrolysing)
MAFGLELRSPFLDHRLAEFAASLPTAMRAGKRLLRRVLHRHVPPALVERPKMGFGAPVARWLRGELRPWCEDLLDPARLRRQGFLDAGEVGRMWREFLGGREYWQAHLWDALMFQAWLAARGD